MQKEIKFELGTKVKDKITGFNGTTTGFAFYLTGCDQYSVTPKMKEGENSYPDCQWFDVNRLEPTGDESIIEIDTSIDSGPMNHPSKC